MTGLKNVNRLTLAQQDHGDLFSAVWSILASLSSLLATLLFWFTHHSHQATARSSLRSPLQAAYTALNSRQTKLAPR